MGNHFAPTGTPREAPACSSASSVTVLGSRSPTIRTVMPYAIPASPVRGGNNACPVGHTLAAYSMASATRSQSSATRSFSPMEAKSRPAPHMMKSRSPSKAPL